MSAQVGTVSLRILHSLRIPIVVFQISTQYLNGTGQLCRLSAERLEDKQ
jgi:hypothetical protein